MTVNTINRSFLEKFVVQTPEGRHKFVWKRGKAQDGITLITLSYKTGETESAIIKKGMTIALWVDSDKNPDGQLEFAELLGIKRQKGVAELHIKWIETKKSQTVPFESFDRILTK